MDEGKQSTEEDAAKAAQKVHKPKRQSSGLLGTMTVQEDTLGLKIAKTVAFCGTQLAMGAYVSMIGPTLLDIADRIHVGIGDISSIFIFLAIGGMLGALSSGQLFEYMNAYILLAFTAMLAAGAVAAIPWCRSLWVLNTMFVTVGFCQAMKKTGTVVQTLDIWQKANAPFMQAILFGYGLGGFIAPFLSRPFLSTSMHHHLLHPSDGTTEAPRPVREAELVGDPSPEQPPPSTTTTVLSEHIGSMLIADSDSNAQNLHQNSQLEVDEPSRIEIPFSMVAAYICLVGISYLVFFCMGPRTCRAMKIRHDEPDKKGVPAEITPFKVIYVLLIFFMVYCTIAMEDSYFLFIVAYAVKSSLNFSKSRAVILNATYWATFVFGRAITIPIARYVSANIILGVDVLLVLVSAVLLAIFKDSSDSAIWVGSAIKGLGHSSSSSAILSLAENYIQVTYRLGSLFIFGKYLAMVTLLPLVGHLFESVGPNMLMYIELLLAILWAVCYIIIQVVIRAFGTPASDTQSEASPLKEKKPAEERAG